MKFKQKKSIESLSKLKNLTTLKLQEFWIADDEGVDESLMNINKNQIKFLELTLNKFNFRFGNHNRRSRSSLRSTSNKNNNFFKYLSQIFPNISRITIKSYLKSALHYLINEYELMMKLTSKLKLPQQQRQQPNRNNDNHIFQDNIYFYQLPMDRLFYMGKYYREKYEEEQKWNCYGYVG